MQSRWLVFFMVLLLSAVSVQAVINEHSTKIFAITNDGKGLSADLDLRISPGTGKIFSGVDALVGTSTQNAYKTALEVTKKYFPNANQYDYYFSINSTASIVDGPSAGGATALLMVSMLQDKKIPAVVAMTGTLSENGQIGTVGGVFEKSKAASQAGIKLFLIPKGEARQVTRTENGIKSINLIEYAPKEWGLKVVEVENLDEALKLAFSDIESIDINKQIQESNEIFVPESISFHSQVAPLHGITEKYLERAKEQLKDAKAELNTTILTDTELVQVMFESVSESEKVLDQAQRLYDQNFLYSSANFAFTAAVNAMLVKDIAQNPSILNENSAVFKEKLDKLKKELDSLKGRLDGRILSDQLDWQVAAQQRWLWAYNNVQSLENTQTIVIRAPGEPGISSPQLDRLRDFEFAVAWKIAVDDFSLELQNAKQQTANSSIFEEYADEQLINAENSLPLVQEDERVDIQRRMDGAKTAQSMKWFLPEAADAASVSALIEAEQETKGKDLNQLESLLNQKISELDKKLAEENPYVWARIYLDHARYFQQAVQYHQKQGRTSQALDAAQGGISVVFLAQSAFETHQKIYSLAANAPTTPYQSQPFKPLPSENQKQYYWVLALAGFLFVAAIIILLAAFLQKKKETSGEGLISSRQLLRQSAELDKQFAQAKIGKEEYLKKRHEFAEELARAQEQKGVPSEAEIEKVGNRISGLEKELQGLRKSLKEGKVSEQQFSEKVDSIQKQLQETKSQLQNHEARVSIAKSQSESASSLEQLASEVKKRKTSSQKPKAKRKNIGTL